MDQGLIDFETLRDELHADRRPAWMKLVLGPLDNGLGSVWQAQILVGPRPDDWEARRWAYPECTFVTFESDARRLAVLLVPGPQELRLEHEVALFDFADSTMNWYHHHSRERYAELETPWPSKTITPSFAQPTRQPPNGHLVAPNTPSFPMFSGAYAAFVDNNWVQSGRQNPVLGQMTIRIVDERARITKVFAGLTALSVWVDGKHVVGTHLEFNSSTDRDEKEVERLGQIDFPLPNGLGQDGRVWLKDDDEWLDFKSIASWGGGPSPDVEIETPEDPVGDIEALANQGESTYLEYKRLLPDDKKENKRKAFKDIVAFANGNGGTLLFGVDGDDDVGEVVGLVGQPAALQRRVNDLIRALVTPIISPRIAGHDIDGKFVIRVDVDPGNGVIHALVVDSNKPEYYVRRNASSYFARPEELASLVKPTAAAPNPEWPYSIRA